MNDEQQLIVNTLERGNLVGRANGETRILGGTSIQVSAANDVLFNAALNMPHNPFSIERSAASKCWVGLVEMRESTLCVYVSADPVIVAQGVANYFALAQASGMALRQMRTLLHLLEAAYIQIFAESSTHINLFWDDAYGSSTTWILDTENEKQQASIYLDLDTRDWTLKTMTKKKRASGTLADVVQAAITLRNLPVES